MAGELTLRERTLPLTAGEARHSIFPPDRPVGPMRPGLAVFFVVGTLTIPPD